MLAGDAIQNLRAALDHIVYAASGGEEQTKFPIFTDPAKFQQKAPGMLKGVPASVAATIEKAQPYRNSPRPGSDDARAAPRSLEPRQASNPRHRREWVVHEGVGVREGVNIAWQRSNGRPLGSGETHVSTFTASSEAGLDQGDVQPMFGYEVRIEGRPLSYLKGFVHDIYPVLAECETGEPLSLFAPYPL